MKNLTLLFFLIVVSLTLFISPSEGQNGWSLFQKQHVPDNQDRQKSYWTWNRNLWNNWLRNRTNYGVKDINSVMSVKTAQVILDDYKNSKITEKKGQQTLWWSTQKYTLYVFKKTSKGDYDGWVCDNKYVLAALDNKQPYHMEGYSATQSSVGSDVSKCKIIYPKKN